jgi:hypothetical protein
MGGYAHVTQKSRFVQPVWSKVKSILLALVKSFTASSFMGIGSMPLNVRVQSE